MGEKILTNSIVLLLRQIDPKITGSLHKINTMNNISNLLEKYIEGKDLDRHSLLEEIYCPNAVVSFKIEADNINFPSEIRGNVEIAKVLSADFNKKYDLVKTYYLSNDFSKSETLVIREQNWLVIMKERSNGNIRIGTGYYNWEFEGHNQSELKIKRHKIFIYAMLDLPKESIILLHNLQKSIKYPWVGKAEVIQALFPFEKLKPICDYLKL